MASGGYLGKWYVDKKFTAVMDIAKAAVPMHDYAEFRGKCIQDNEWHSEKYRCFIFAIGKVLITRSTV